MCSDLLKQYNRKKMEVSEKTRKMETVREALEEVRSACLVTENNYREIMNHLGSEIEIG